MKSGNLNFLEPSGPLQACNGTALPFNKFIIGLYMFFEHYVLIIKRSKLYYTASGIITLKQVSSLKLLEYISINMST